jgi:cytochrome c biogenesis protein CcmG/thiol:disulfide interchange protein DsbE
MKRDRVYRMPTAKAVNVLKFAVLAGAAGALIYTFTGARVSSGHLADPAARKQMPQIALSDLQGRPWTLSEHRGNVVVVNFWATWCPPCRMETPDLVQVANEYSGKGVSIVGISMDDDPHSAAPPFVARYKIPYPVLAPDASFALGNSIESLPTTLLIDRSGRLARAYTSMITADVLRADLDRLLAENEGRS